MSNKIRIILIDDNPTSDLIQNRTVEVFRKDGIEGFEGLEDMFELKWIRTTEDTKRYIDYFQEAEKLVPGRLLEQGVFIPELVCFDYSMMGGRHEGLFTEEYNGDPTVALRKILAMHDAVLPEIGDQPEILFKQMAGNKSYDLFGCFCGGLILKLLRDYPVTGVPTTQHPHEDVKQSYAEVFEWLINYDLKEAFEVKQRQSPHWHLILDFGIRRLEKRIKSLSLSDKIKLDMKALMKLADTAIKNSPDEKILTFYSPYGKRDLLIEGLFIYEPREKRAEAISNFANELLELNCPGLQPRVKRLKNSESSLTKFDILNTSIKEAESFWQVYSNFNNRDIIYRIELSELYARDIYSKFDPTHFEPLTNLEEKKLKERKEHFGYDATRKELTNRTCDLRNIEDLVIRRWVALLLIVRMEHYFWSVREKIDQLSADGSGLKSHGAEVLENNLQFLKQSLHKSDIYYAFFPIASDPIIIPPHCRIEHYRDKLHDEFKKTYPNEILTSEDQKNIQRKI